MHLAVTDVVVSPEDSSWMKGMDGSVFMWHLWTGCASEVVGGCPRITSVQWVSDRRLTGAVSKTVISLCLTPMYGLWSTDLTFQIKHLQSIPHQGTNYSRRSVFIWSAAHIIFTAKREKKKSFNCKVLPCPLYSPLHTCTVILWTLSRLWGVTCQSSHFSNSEHMVLVC